jgi:ABC-type uncharacterized transport system involved in gliding motility auxiliary subunit
MTTQLPVNPRFPFVQRPQSGGALAMVLHCVLLVCVLGQIVFLASRHRIRLDLTSDGLYSLTDSTRGLLDKLDKQLIIEAYFSPQEKLPVNYRETRVVLDNFLDELLQLGKGRVVLQRFDPNSDKAIADKCQRIGVKPLELRSGTSSSISVDRGWQGLRFVYGGGKQKVIEQIAPQSSFLAEAQLTPAIKELLTTEKHKFGYMEWPATAVGQQQPGGIGWNALRTHPDLTKRFEFQNYKDEDGALLPPDLQTLFLYRPKDLTDRQKYVLDQFVVRGGTLVVFADAAEYAIGQNRMFTKMPLALDAAGSQKKLIEQLSSYGIDWKPKVLADMSPEAYMPKDRLQGAQEYLSLPPSGGYGLYQVVPYPYFFHAVSRDWSAVAEKFAETDGKVDDAVAAQYRKDFVAGMPSDEFLFKTFKQIGRGPGFYWPTWVGLREKAGGVLDLPEGITGKVLLWSSPAMLAEDPPQSLDPLGQGDMQRRNEQYTKFQMKLAERYKAEPRRQAPLMVDVRGRFTSYFADAERPKRPSEIKEEEARKAADAKAAEQPKEGEKPEDAQDAPKDIVGPEAPKPADAEVAKAPPGADMQKQGDKPGRIVVVGDSDFLRDDFVQNTYVQAGGPLSRFGPAFFGQMLDWLAEDRDLVALQSRIPVDRTLTFVDTSGAPSTDPRKAEQALVSKTRWLRGLNIALPAVLLALFGFVVMAIRRAQKRSFLESLNS